MTRTLTPSAVLAKHKTNPNLALLLEDLVVLWRETRSPRLADAIERLGLQSPDDFQKGIKAALGRATDRGIGATAKRLKKEFARMNDDPRLTVVLMGWVLAPKWQGSSAMHVWEAVFERLATLRDARAIAPLRRATTELPPFLGAGHRNKMAEALKATADAVEEACRSVPKASRGDEELAELEDLLEQPVADFFAPKRKGTSASTLDLVKRVWDHPDDDDVRRVTADALLEAGDPWGELIMLQMSGAKKDTAERIAALLRKHGTAVCGPIGKVAKVASRVFEKGFLVECTTNATMMGRGEWEPAATCPHWATVRRVHFDMSATPLWWLTEWARSPSTKNVGWMEICWWHQSKVVLERSAAAFAVTKLGEGATKYQGAFQKLVAGFPPGDRARITIPEHRNAALFRAMLAPV